MMTDDFNQSFINSLQNGAQKTITTLETSTINQQNFAHLPNAEEIYNQVISAVRPMFARMFNEILSLRKEGQELKATKITARPSKIPGQPFKKKVEEFLEFEKSLQENEHNYFLFENELKLIAKSPNFMKKCWRKLLTDELGEQLCWKGTETKKSVRNLAVTKAIRNAAISIENSEDQFIKETPSVFNWHIIE